MPERATRARPLKISPIFTRAPPDAGGKAPLRACCHRLTRKEVLFEARHGMPRTKSPAAILCRFSSPHARCACGAQSAPLENKMLVFKCGDSNRRKRCRRDVRGDLFSDYLKADAHSSLYRSASSSRARAKRMRASSASLTSFTCSAPSAATTLTCFFFFFSARLASISSCTWRFISSGS